MNKINLSDQTQTREKISYHNRITNTKQDQERLQTQVQRACCEQVRFGQGEKKGIMTNDLQN